MPRIHDKMMVLEKDHIVVLKFVGYDKIMELTKLSRSYVRFLCAKRPKYGAKKKMRQKHWNMILDENKKMRQL